MNAYVDHFKDKQSKDKESSRQAKQYRYLGVSSKYVG